jgi:hypothetical protein
MYNCAFDSVHGLPPSMLSAYPCRLVWFLTVTTSLLAAQAAREERMRRVRERLSAGARVKDMDGKTQYRYVPNFWFPIVLSAMQE